MGASVVAQGAYQPRNAQGAWWPGAAGGGESVEVTPDTLALALDAPAPAVGVQVATAVAPPALSLVLDGPAPTVAGQIAVEVTPAALSLVLDNPAPSVAGVATVEVTPPSLSLVLDDPAPAVEALVLASVEVTPEALALALDAPAPTVACLMYPLYPAASAGHAYTVSVRGRIGGGSGVDVEVGDLLLCIVDTVAGDQATVGANWLIIPAIYRFGSYVAGDPGATGYVTLTIDGTAYKLLANSA